MIKLNIIVQDKPNCEQLLHFLIDNSAELRKYYKISVAKNNDGKYLLSQNISTLPCMIVDGAKVCGLNAIKEWLLKKATQNRQKNFTPNMEGGNKQNNGSVVDMDIDAYLNSEIHKENKDEEEDCIGEEMTSHTIDTAMRKLNVKKNTGNDSMTNRHTGVQDNVVGRDEIDGPPQSSNMPLSEEDRMLNNMLDNKIMSD